MSADVCLLYRTSEKHEATTDVGKVLRLTNYE